MEFNCSSGKSLLRLITKVKFKIDCSKTSIWDKTLYSAWSKILTQLVPNRQKLEGELRRFVDETEADEGIKDNSFRKINSF